MNQEKEGSEGLGLLLANINHRHLHHIVSFLDTPTVELLTEALAHQPGHLRSLLEVLRVRLFLQNYLTRTDRSIYMPFYAEQSFRSIEDELQRQICAHSARTLCYFLSAYETLAASLSTQLAALPEAEQVATSITDSLFDPELPFPKLRKQTVGMHCHSGFQYFLVDRLMSPEEDPDLQETFETLRDFLQPQWLVPPNQEEKGSYEKVMREWYRISYQNYQDFLLAGRAGHNTVVIVIAYLDLLIDSSQFYVQSIGDPLHCFVEFTMRYCMLRNAVLALEEKLSFLLVQYVGFCGEKVREWQGRELSIWHIALSKWYLHMHRNHSDFFAMYFYLLRKVNFIAIANDLQPRLAEHPSFIELQNRLELHDLDLLGREQCFDQYSPLEEYFQEDCELYKQLIQEYVEYTIDISINEYSVHWCGHSEHQLHVPYQEFQALFMPNFQAYLGKLIAFAQQIPHSFIALDSAVCSLLDQLDSDFLKPVTLKKAMGVIQRQMAKAAASEYESSLSAKKMASMGYFMSAQDKKIAVFNNQSGIPNQANLKYSIIVQNQDFNRMLKESSSTAATNCKSKALFLSQESSRSIEGEEFC